MNVRGRGSHYSKELYSSCTFAQTPLRGLSQYIRLSDLFFKQMLRNDDNYLNYIVFL